MSSLGIAKSLRKANNLIPLVDTIKNYVTEKKKQEGLQQLADLISQTQRGIDKSYAPSTGIDNATWEQPNNMQSLTRPITDGQNALQNRRERFNGKPEQPPIEMNEQPSDMILGNVGEVDYRQGDRNSLRGITDYINKGMLNPNIDQDKLKQGLTALELRRSLFQRPKKNYISVNQTDDIYEVDPETGERTLSKEGIKKPIETVKYETDDKGERKVYTLANGQKAYKKLTYLGDKLVKEDIEQLQFEPKGTTVNVEDKYPEIHLANLKRDLTEDKDAYTYWDKKSKDDKETPEKRKEAEDQKGIYFGRIKGTTDALVSQINTKVPSFEGVLNLLYQKIGSDPSIIDSTVEETLKGKNADLIRWAKEILHSRIF